MKTKIIFRGVAAGLTSLSLLLSGMPVMATESSSVDPQQTQSQGQMPGLPEEIKGQPRSTASEETEREPQSELSEEPQSELSEEPGAEPQAPDDIFDPEAETEAAKQPQPKDGEESNEEKQGKDHKEIEERQDSQGEEASEAEQEDQYAPRAFSIDDLSVVNGSITVDGILSDWAEVTERKASRADSWKVAFSPDGGIVYFCYTGSAGTEWDYSFASNNNSFKFTYADGTAGEDAALSIHAWQDGALVKNAIWGDVPGASVAVTNEANGNNPGPYTVEFAVPASFFHNLDFVVEFGGTSVGVSEIQKVNGNPLAVETKPIYTGIDIDGNYSDWAAVAKTETSCPNEQHKGCLSQAAAVYDGDWLYLYIKDGKGSNASGAGTHSNGKYAIKSDLGYETDIQLSTAPAVSGVDGAQVAYVGSEWEIAIPKDQLPKYRESLTFGFYEGDVIVSGIVNLQPDHGNNLENLFNGIIYDGSYEDWEDYGHTTIEYATAGSQESQVDAKGALYSSEDKLFAHVVTGMPQHLQEAGGEFTSAVTIAFNQKQSDLQNGAYDHKMAFYPRFVTVDAGGNINWDPKLSGLPEGTYEYYIASTDAWHTSTNINNLNEMDQLYGKMMMTVGKDGKDEMEFYLELPMIAGKLGVDETDLKEISAQFGRIGQQWLYTAGTSTGPIVGVTLCIATAGFILWYKKKSLMELLLSTAK